MNPDTPYKCHKCHHISRAKDRVPSEVGSNCISCGYAFAHPVDEVQLELQDLKQRLAASEAERDRAVAEANRRDQKWMDGIDAIVGRKLRYTLATITDAPGFDLVPDLQDFITDLRAKLAFTEQENEKLRESQQHWRSVRQEGRREALAIIVRQCPEGFIEKCQGSRAIADTGDYDSHWNEKALAELLQCEKMESFAEYCEGKMWEAMGEKSFRDLELVEKATDAQSRAQQAVEERDELSRRVRSFIVQLKAGEVHCKDAKDSVGIATGAALKTIADQLGLMLEALSTPKTEGRTDGERLDWLEKNKTHFECTSDSSDFVIFLPESRGSGPLAPLLNRSIRDAIDAVMSASLPTSDNQGEVL